jgi:YD repeat-containing protein
VGPKWDIERAVLHIDGPAKTPLVDLTPPPQREAFQYPTRSRVYLLPLDDQAVIDIAGLSAYFKARLGLDVLVLPQGQLHTGCVDPSGRQVLAETALDGIEDDHPEMIRDLDSVVVAITSRDLNIVMSGWDFSLNYRRGRVAIVGTARLHDVPRFGSRNPEAYPVRVRKLVAKNVALLTYPLDLTTDETSVLAIGTFTTDDVDKMGQNLRGEFGTAEMTDSTAPCITVMHGPGRAQSWRVGCTNAAAVADSQIETTETYFEPALFVTSRMAFTVEGERRFALVRKYRTLDQGSRAFGIGASDSLDIFPVGDASTFSYIKLILADGGRIHYSRTSPGKDYGTARLAAKQYMGNPFSLSSMTWNNGWDIVTRDGWGYHFPSSRPGRTWQQSALLGIRAPADRWLKIHRTPAGDLHDVQVSNGYAIELVVNSNHAITTARDSRGRRVEYEYDDIGRLVRVGQPELGDEFYQYDPSNRLTSILDAEHHVLIANTCLSEANRSAQWGGANTKLNLNSRCPSTP